MNRVARLILGLLDPESPRPDAVRAAELAAGRPDGAASRDEGLDKTVRMAARLDGGLNDEEQSRFDRDLATDGRDMQELVAAAELLDAVSTHRAAVPADLLAQVVAAPAETPLRSRRRRWLWLGGAVLAAALAMVLALHRPPAPAGGSDPVMAAPAGGSDPVMAAPAGGSDPEKAAPDRPSGELPRMAPAGNQDMVPLPRKR